MTPRLLATLLAAVLFTPCLSAQDADTEGFIPLYNGKDLSGWVPCNVAADTFQAMDGYIMTTGIPTGVMRTERMYENFIIELEWRHLKEAGNAGLFIWGESIPAPGVPFSRGIEVQILDPGYEKNKGAKEWFTSHGDIFPIWGATMTPVDPVAKGGKRSFPKEDRVKPSPEWNHYRAVCNNGEIRLSVNGKEVTVGRDCLPRKGYICLESEGSEAHFRNIRIKELPSTMKGANRLLTRHKKSIIVSLPKSYEAQIASIPGVERVAPQVWFGGIYKDDLKNFFASMAVDPESYLDVCPEFSLPAEQKAAWLKTRTGAIVGKATAEKYGMKIGDKVALKSPIWEPPTGKETWEFEIVGIYTGTKKEVDDTAFYLRYDHFDEVLKQERANVTWYGVRIKDPTKATSIANLIDAHFANSPFETKTEPEEAWMAGFADQTGAKSATPAETAREFAGFKQLFDGKTLKGWATPDDLDKWWSAHGAFFHVKEGKLGKGKDLWTEKSYKDFQLIVDWRMPKKPEPKKLILIAPNGKEAMNPDGTKQTVEVMDAGDSGVFLRGTKKAQINIFCRPCGSGEVNGFRMAKDTPDATRNLYVPKEKADNKPGAWNRFVITLQKGKLSVELNEKLVIDQAPVPDLPEKGPIGLQHHGDEMQFGNIFIKEL